jgi:hypothetical protein
MSKKILNKLLVYFPLLYIDSYNENYKELLLIINILSKILHNNTKLCKDISKNLENVLIQNCHNNMIIKYMYIQGFNTGIFNKNKILDKKYINSINYDISLFYSEKKDKILSFCIYKVIKPNNTTKLNGKIYIELLCNNYKSGLAYQLIKNLAKKFTNYDFELCLDHSNLENIYKLWGFTKKIIK